MDKCGYCEHMVPSGVNHYCKEELLKEISDLIKKFEDFYPAHKRRSVQWFYLNEEDFNWIEEKFHNLLKRRKRYMKIEIHDEKNGMTWIKIGEVANLFIHSVPQRDIKELPEEKSTVEVLLLSTDGNTHFSIVTTEEEAENTMLASGVVSLLGDPINVHNIKSHVEETGIAPYYPKKEDE